MLSIDIKGLKWIMEQIIEILICFCQHVSLSKAIFTVKKTKKKGSASAIVYHVNNNSDYKSGSESQIKATKDFAKDGY